MLGTCWTNVQVPITAKQVPVCVKWVPTLPDNHRQWQLSELTILHCPATPIPVGAGRSSDVERSLMVRWVVGSILHGVDPLSYFSFQPVLPDWCNKGSGMCYPVCGMVHIKESLLLIDKSSLCGGSGFPFSLSLTICLMPYITVDKMCWVHH